MNFRNDFKSAGINPSKSTTVGISATAFEVGLRWTFLSLVLNSSEVTGSNLKILQNIVAFIKERVTVLSSLQDKNINQLVPLIIESLNRINLTTVEIKIDKKLCKEIQDSLSQLFSEADRFTLETLENLTINAKRVLRETDNFSSESSASTSTSSESSSTED